MSLFFQKNELKAIALQVILIKYPHQNENLNIVNNYMQTITPSGYLRFGCDK